MMLLAISMMCAFIPEKAFADTPTFTNSYHMVMDSNENIYVEIKTWITNPTQAQTHINTYGEDGTYYKLVKSYSSNPRTAGYIDLGGILFNSSTSNTTEATAKTLRVNVTKYWELHYFKEGTANKPKVSEGLYNVTFTGDPCV